MAGPITDRFLISRQSYERVTDLQGRLLGLDPALDAVHTDDDSESTAQFVTDLAYEDPGIIFTVVDTRGNDFITVVRERETREELLAAVRSNIERLMHAAERDPAVA